MTAIHTFGAATGITFLVALSLSTPVRSQTQPPTPPGTEKHWAPSPCILALATPDTDAATADIIAKSVVQYGKFMVPAPAPACTRGEARCVLAQADTAKCGWVLHYGPSVYPAPDGTKLFFFDAYDASGRFRRLLCSGGCGTEALGSAFTLVSSRFTAFGQISYMQPDATVRSAIFLGQDDIHWTLVKEPGRRFSLMHGKYSFRVPTIDDYHWIRSLHGSMEYSDGRWLMLEGNAGGSLIVLAVSFLDEAGRDTFADALHQAAHRSVPTPAPTSATP